MTTENDLEFAVQEGQTQQDKIQGGTKVELGIRQKFHGSWPYDDRIVNNNTKLTVYMYRVWQNVFLVSKGYCAVIESRRIMARGGNVCIYVGGR